MYNYSPQLFKLPSINQYKSSIEFIPRKPEYLNKPQKQLQVGLDPKALGLSENVPKTQIKKQIKYYDEFPAYYLDLLPMPQQYSEEKKNYTILQFDSKPPSQHSTNLRSTKQGKFPKPQINPLKIPTSLTQSSLKTSIKRVPSLLLKRLIRRVKILVIIKEFYNLLINALYEKIEVIKRQTSEDFKENIVPAQKLLQEWVKASLGDFLPEILRVKESLQLRISDEAQNPNRKKIISTLLDTMMKNMLKVDITQYFTKQLAFILSFVTQSYQFPQNKFYFKFEMQRIRATATGSLGVMQAPQQKMVLFVLLIVKSIIFNQVFKAWSQYLNDEDEHIFTMQTNCMILTSILHEMVIQWIEKNVRRKRGLDIDYMKEQFQYLDQPLTLNPQLMKQQAKKFEVNQLIDGILTDKALSKYIYNENGILEDWFTKSQMDLVVLIDQIHDQLNKEYSNKQIQHERVCSMMAKFYQASLLRRAN